MSKIKVLTIEEAMWNIGQYKPSKVRLPKKLVEIGKLKIHADTQYYDAFANYYSRLKTQLPHDKFWQIIEFLRKLIANRGFTYDKLKTSIDELFRLTATGESEHPEGGFDGPHVAYNFKDLLQFCFTYEGISDKIDQKLDDFSLGSDDSRGDLMDSLPLAGVKVYENILNGTVKNEQDLEKELKSLAKKWYEFIRNGENYVWMTLKEEAASRALNLMME